MGNAATPTKLSVNNDLADEKNNKMTIKHKIQNLQQKLQQWLGVRARIHSNGSGSICSQHDMSDSKE